MPSCNTTYIIVVYIIWLCAIYNIVYINYIMLYTYIALHNGIHGQSQHIHTDTHRQIHEKDES